MPRLRHSGYGVLPPGRDLSQGVEQVDSIFGLELRVGLAAG